MKLTEEQLNTIFEKEDIPSNKTMRDSIAKQLEELGEEAQEMFDLWYQTGKSPRFNVNGISSNDLRTKFKNIKDLAIILAYDHIIKSPKEALKLFTKKPLM